jgi:CO dehydrogenase maturation factor
VSTAIAISGKGGSGKTTVAAMIVRHLVEGTLDGSPHGGGSVLAVDADPNACLGLALGLQPETTIADIREETLDRKRQPGPGMDRARALEYALQQAVAEAKGFDLLTMGQPEGAKCYCAVNHLLREYLDAAAREYRWVVLDCEAGMEHLSRRTTDSVEHLVVVAEPTVMGAATARRILGLSERLPISVGRRTVLWNKVKGMRRAEGGTGNSGIRIPESGLNKGNGLPVLGEVPFDPAVLDLAERGGTIFELPADSSAFRAVGDLLAELLRPM